MNKFLIPVICLVLLTFGANAFALVAYDQTYSFAHDATLNNGNGNSSTSFDFTSITDNFIASATKPYPTLSLILRGSNTFNDDLKLSLNNQTLATITTENPTYVFNSITLGYLNNSVRNGSVSFSLVRNSGTSTLSSARLTGTVAPEPASMALVFTGLAALPFTRRIRKAIRTQI